MTFTKQISTSLVSSYRRYRLPIASLAATTTLAACTYQGVCKKNDEAVLTATAKPQQQSNEMTKCRSNYIYHSFLPIGRNSLCESGSPKVSRSDTLRRLKDTSSKAKLKSRYNVQWKNPLGEGGFGTVFLATDRRSGNTVAVKKISKDFTDNSSFQKEMNALLHIRESGGHPNICSMREHFEEGGHYYLVIDLIRGGEMFDHLCNNGAYSEADAARLVREIASSLAFLHGTGCVHGDLKPENIMLSSVNYLEAVCKLVDFGCAQIIDSKSSFYEPTDVIGGNTPGYSPPEVVNQSQKRQEPSVDMFSLGVIVYIMLTGVHPFDLSGTSSPEEINELVQNHKPPPLEKSSLTEHLSPSAIDLIRKLIQWDPKKRLSAQEMLNHPWVRGETARTGKIADSDKRLSAFKKYKSRLEAAVFQSMVEWSGNDCEAAKKTSLIQRSFQMLDAEQRGYITTRDLRKLDPTDVSDAISNDEDDQLSLSDFSRFLARNMKNKYFPAGHTIYKEGDRGNNMFFINSGRVEIVTANGFRTTMDRGDFFGEGALLDPKGRRSASIRCLTPVHAIEISRKYFGKYMSDGYDTALNLRETDRRRKRDRARTILQMQDNMHEIVAEKGDMIFEQGAEGEELFLLGDGQVDILVGNHTVFTVPQGGLCGEYSLLFSRPRNTSAKCMTPTCTLQVLPSQHFQNVMESHPAVKKSIWEICLRREFQKALVFSTRKSFPVDARSLQEAFECADYDRSGHIDLQDVSVMLKNMDPTFTDEDIGNILKSLDLDQSGNVNWEEFKRIFGMTDSKKKRIYK